MLTPEWNTWKDFFFLQKLTYQHEQITHRWNVHGYFWLFCGISVFSSLKAIIRRHLLTRYLTPFHLLIKKNKLLEVSSAVHEHSSPSRRTRPAWLLRHGSCIERKPLFLSPANRIDTFKQRRRTPSRKHKTLFEPRFPRGPRGIKGAGRCCDLSFSRG